jgi:hypothetical protein
MVELATMGSGYTFIPGSLEAVAFWEEYPKRKATLENRVYLVVSL